MTTAPNVAAVRRGCEPGARHAISSWRALLGWPHLATPLLSKGLSPVLAA